MATAVETSPFLQRLVTRLDSQQHCDVTLRFPDDHSMDSSWLILTALSPVFEAMYQSECKETQEGVVTLPTVDHGTFSAILAFSLGEEDAVTPGNASEVLEVAHLLMMDALKSRCVAILSRSLSPHTCLRSLFLSQLYDLPALQSASRSYFYLNIIDVSKTESFRDLELSQLKLLLQDAASWNVSNDMLCMAYLNWLRDKSLPEVQVNKLLSAQVKHHLLTEYFVRNVLQSEKRKRDYSNPLKPNTSPCALTRASQQLGKESEWSCGKESLSSSWSSSSSSKVERTKAEVVGGIFVFKVMNLSGYIISVYEWQSDLESWQPRSNPQYIFRDGFAVAVLHGDLYITGTGIFGGPTVTCTYGRLRQEWTRAGDVRSSRSFHGMAASGDALYVVGGFNKDGLVLKTVEVFSPKTRQWSFAGALAAGVYACSVGAVRDTLVVVGKMALGGPFQNLIQTFNTTTRQSSFYVNKLPDSMANHGRVQAATLDDVILLVSSEGDLVILTPRHNDVTVTWRARLPVGKSLKDGRFAVYADGDRVVVANASTGSRPKAYDIQGRLVDGCAPTGHFPTVPIPQFSGTANLSSAMYVHTLYKLQEKYASED